MATAWQGERAAGPSAAVLVGGGALLGALPLLALALDADLAVPVAGVALLAAGFAVMVPCEVQMAATMAVVLRRAAQRDGAARGPGAVRRSGLAFAAGYVGFYVPVAAALGGVAAALGSRAWLLAAAGAATSAVLGLSALGRIRLGALARCRGPLWLLRSGRASFSRPLRGGAAFGQYCATCCGPYVVAIAIVAGATGDALRAGALVLAYALLMAAPFVVAVLVQPDAYARLGEHAARLAQPAGRVSGGVLVALGAVLAPVTVVLAVT